MVILVTGSDGFIGKHLCDRLRNLGHEVITADRKSGEDILAWRGRIPHVDVVYHLAAETGLASTFGAYLANNVLATQNLLGMLDCNRLRRFILTSTSSVYGANAVCNEFGVRLPISNYGVTKLMQEELCRMYERTQGLPLTIMRLFSVYGPGQRIDMAIAKFIKAALNDQPVTVYGNGEQRRGVTYIDNVVDALVLTMGIPTGTYNVGGTEQVNTNGILNLLAENVAHKKIEREYVPAREGDQEETLADSRKIKHLGWQCNVTFADGLRRQYKAALEEHRGN